MAKKLFGIFDKRPLIWFHYVLLTGIIFLAHHYSGFLENKVVAGESFAWIWLFLWYVAFVGIGDQIIHKILGVD